MAPSRWLCDNSCMTDTQAKDAAPPHPATTVLLLRPSRRGDSSSPLEVFMVVRHHQIDSFSGALVFPGGKLEEADGDARLRACCTGAAALGDDELKFRVAGVREAFEECGVLLAHKRGRRELIGAAELAPIEMRWREKLAKDEASIVDLVEAEDLELATDLMVPYAHWITPTFVPKRFDTWFFLAEAPADQVALHDGSESVDSVWIGAQAAIDEAAAGRRTLVHPTLKNLELLAEGGSVAGAIAQARQREIVTVQPWVEARDGKRFLRIPEGAGYRNLVREMPPAPVSQAGR
jgi:8-oxo-dGTP pyrophosphatase MutT (NUDIX family)